MSHLILVGPLPPPYYGQSVSFRMLLDEIQRIGHPHIVVDLAHGEASSEKIGLVTWGRAAEYAGILSRFAVAAARRPSTVYLTIAQSRQGFLRDCVIIWLSALFRHRVVVHLKGGNYGSFYAAAPRWLRWLIRRTLRRTERILILGERLRTMFDFDPLLADRVRVVPNGLPDATYTSPSQGKRLPAPPEPVRVIFLSNLVESKGWLDVLVAMRLLRDRSGGRAVHCDFYGLFLENPADDVRVQNAAHARVIFEEYVQEHDLSGMVQYHGVVSGAQKRRVLEEAHFFLLPTRYNNEGQPVSIIEAISTGTIVVSTDYRAIPDMVVDGTTGVLVDAGAPEQIAAAIDRLMHDPVQYGRMSDATLEYFAAKFTREGHLRMILPHLLHGHGVAAGPRPREEARRSPVTGTTPHLNGFPGEGG